MKKYSMFCLLLGLSTLSNLHAGKDFENLKQCISVISTLSKKSVVKNAMNDVLDNNEGKQELSKEMVCGAIDEMEKTFLSLTNKLKNGMKDVEDKELNDAFKSMDFNSAILTYLTVEKLKSSLEEFESILDNLKESENKKTTPLMLLIEYCNKNKQ